MLVLHIIGGVLFIYSLIMLFIGMTGVNRHWHFVTAYVIPAVAFLAGIPMLMHGLLNH